MINMKEAGMFTQDVDCLFQGNYQASEYIHKYYDVSECSLSLTYGKTKKSEWTTLSVTEFVKHMKEKGDCEINVLSSRKRVVKSFGRFE